MAKQLSATHIFIRDDQPIPDFLSHIRVKTHHIEGFVSDEGLYESLENLRDGIAENIIRLGKDSNGNGEDLSALDSLMMYSGMLRFILWQLQSYEIRKQEYPMIMEWLAALGIDHEKVEKVFLQPNYHSWKF